MKSVKLKTVLMYIIVLLIIINCRSVYVHTLTNNISNSIYLLLIVAIIFYILLTRIKKDELINSLIVVMLYIMLLILYAVISDISRGTGTFVIRFLIILPLSFILFSIISKNEIIDFFKTFVNITIALSIISLFFFIFGTIFNIIKNSGIIKFEWGEITTAPNYYYLYFNTQSSYILGKILKRNTGIFTEAPMYSLILTIALNIGCFITNEKKTKKSILIMTIISTLSITGITMAIIICILNYIINNKVKIKYIVTPILIIIGLLGIQYFIEDKQETMSYFTRMDDFCAGFSAWKENPIFGNGFLNSDIIQKYMSKSRIYNTGVASSLIIVATQGGIYLLMIYLYPIIRTLVKSMKMLNKPIIAFTGVMSVLFVTTAFQYTILAITFVSMGLALKNSWLE